jgi:O-acetyl-ADP-ribose deacetylase (regulator of RNase III)
MERHGSSMERKFLGGRITVLIGDLTRQEVDAIVNAANQALLGGGGVDGAIHRAGGPAILAACRELRRTAWPQGLPTGEAVITTGGNLLARYVIHTVGPIHGEEAGREAALLHSCYQNSLAVAARHQLERVAFPAISTGVYHYPWADAARVSSLAIQAALPTLPEIEEVRLVFFTPAEAEAFLAHQAFAE